MGYIKRDIENKILALSKEYSCILVTGPRQVGKTTVLKQLMDEDREYVTLDDLEERSLVKRGPAMFLQMHSTPIMIDEVKYAPELFSYIKIQIDNGATPGTCGAGSLLFGQDMITKHCARRCHILLAEQSVLIFFNISSSAGQNS